MLDELVIHLPDEVGAPVAELRQPQHNVTDQIKAVDVVEDTHVERSGDGTLLLVAADVEVPIVAAVGELVHQRRIAVIREDDRLVPCEDGGYSNPSKTKSHLVQIQV